MASKCGPNNYYPFFPESPTLSQAMYGCWLAYSRRLAVRFFSFTAINNSALKNKFIQDKL